MHYAMHSQTVRRARRCRRPATAERIALVFAVGLCICVLCSEAGGTAAAAVATPTGSGSGAERAASPEKGTAGSLEAAAAKASNTGRAVAMSLIGLAFAIAATVLAFRRDFKEAAGVFAVGIVSVLLATPAGVSLLRDTVNSIFGA